MKSTNSVLLVHWKMTRRSHTSWLLALLFIWLSCDIQEIDSLKCRTDEGPSEAELKRITRSCMHRISESTWRSGNGNANSNSYSYSNNYNNSSSNNPFSGSTYGTNKNHNNYYGQQQGSYDGQQSSNTDFYTYNDNFYNKYGYQISNYERSDDIMHQRNLEHDREREHDRGRDGEWDRERDRDRDGERLQKNRNGRTTRSPSNHDRGRDSQNPSNGNNNNNNNNVKNSHIGNNGNHSKYEQNWNSTNSNYDSRCVAHCFFEELNMLNSDDYPDKHKVTFLLTKDMHDRSIRSFYTETIQECYHYMESRHRRDKCMFSRDLVNCMMEYAKANCDDWQEYNMVFN